MKPFYAIMGILSFLVGILCVFDLFAGTATISILLAVFLLLVGFFYIMMFVMIRENRVLSMYKPAIGVAGLLLGIALLVIAVLSIALPNLAEMLQLVTLVVIAFWMIINGIVSVFSGMNYQKKDQRGGTLLVVLGVILTVAGIYGLLHMVIFGERLTFVTGILLLLFGVNLLCGMYTDPNADDNMFGIPDAKEAVAADSEDSAAAVSASEDGVAAGSDTNNDNNVFTASDADNDVFTASKTEEGEE